MEMLFVAGESVGGFRGLLVPEVEAAVAADELYIAQHNKPV